MKKFSLLIVALMLAFSGMSQSKSELASQIRSLDTALQAQNVTIQNLNASVLQLTTLCTNQMVQINALSDSLRTIRNLQDSIRTLRRDLAELSQQIAIRPLEGSNAPQKKETQKDTIINIINQFVTAYKNGNKEEWLKYVLNPEKVKKLELSKENIYPILSGASFRTFTHKSNTWFEVTNLYNVKKVGNTYKIDYESTFAYNKITLTDFEVTQHKTPNTFRVKLSLRNNNDNVFSADKYYRFYAEDGSNKTASLYVRKNSDAAKKLYELTKRGDEVKVIIEAKYVREQNTQYYDIQPVITRFVQEGWITE